MQIYFTRHGQTDWNKAGRWQSRTDIPLNEIGEAQASALRQWVLSEQVKPKWVVTSPLSRAQKTASIAFASLGEHRIESRFIELNQGDYEGRYQTELRQEVGEENYQSWLGSYHQQAAPNGENVFQGVERVQPALKEWIEHSQGQDLVIVAHQGILMAMKAALSGLTDVVSLKSYKQANNEIDVWSVADRVLSRRVSF